MSKTKIYPDAQDVIDRLRARDWRKPRFDKPAVEAALNAHLTALGLPARPIRWLDNLKQNYGYMAPIANAAWGAAREAAKEAAREAARKAALEAASEAADKAALMTAKAAVRKTADKVALKVARAAVRKAADKAGSKAAREAVREEARRAADKTVREAADKAASKAARETAWEAAAREAAAWDAAGEETWSAVWVAVRSVAQEASWNTAWEVIEIEEKAGDEAGRAAWNTALEAAWNTAREAFGDAVLDAVAWEAFRGAAWKAFREAAGCVACGAVREAFLEAAGCAAAINAYNEFPHETIKRLVDMTTPVLEAFENGLYLYGITLKEIVCVPQPELHITNGALHCETGPAVRWPDESYWFWRGYHVPRWVIEEKHRLNPEVIAAEANAELRRVMLEIYGFGRWISETGATLISEDVNHGQPRKLYEATLAGEPVRILHVVNGSLENDGSRREFFLGAPDGVKTPHKTVAALYGFNPEIYSEYART
jgi:hypothetical protein